MVAMAITFNFLKKKIVSHDFPTSNNRFPEWLVFGYGQPLQLPQLFWISEVVCVPVTIATIRMIRCINLNCNIIVCHYSLKHPEASSKCQIHCRLPRHPRQNGGSARFERFSADCAFHIFIFGRMVAKDICLQAQLVNCCSHCV